MCAAAGFSACEVLISGSPDALDKTIRKDARKPPDRVPPMSLSLSIGASSPHTPSGISDPPMHPPPDVALTNWGDWKDRL